MNARIIHREQRPHLSAAFALRVAWIAYAILLAVPFFTSLMFLWLLDYFTGTRTGPIADRWFLASMIIVASIVAGGALVREHFFKDDGHAVTPGKYLAVMIGIWLALAISGLFSMYACYATESVLPNLIPAFMGLGVYCLFWPSKNAMERHTDDERR